MNETKLPSYVDEEIRIVTQLLNKRRHMAYYTVDGLRELRARLKAVEHVAHRIRRRVDAELGRR